MKDGRATATPWSGTETVIWDFNGTLIDDVDLVVQTMNGQLVRRGLAPVTVSQYRDAFGFPVEDYYRRMGMTFDQESMAEFSAEFFAGYESQLAACPIYEGLSNAQARLAKAGLRQFVLSAMEERMLREALEALGIMDRFVAAYGLEHQEADSKVSRGRDLLADFDIRPETALLVGDTAHDADVAKSLGLACALVARGHQSRARLEETRHPVYDDVEELMNALDLSPG